MKNIADDCSFKELERMITCVHYLYNGIRSRQEKIRELEKLIISESIRLKKEGYDITTLNLTIISGREE
jgi:hypothetical protein